jgi:fructose/tagatose bisphosphate aldolase
MSSKKKILQYIEFEEITVHRFEKITGLSHGILRSGSDFGADKLKQIRDNLPDLNMNWLLYDEGEMILSAENKENILNESQENYEKMNINTEMLLKEVENLKNLLEAKQETIDLLKLKFGIQTIGNVQRKQG